MMNTPKNNTHRNNRLANRAAYTASEVNIRPSTFKLSKGLNLNLEQPGLLFNNNKLVHTTDFPASAQNAYRLSNPFNPIVKTQTENNKIEATGSFTLKPKAMQP